MKWYWVFWIIPWTVFGWEASPPQAAFFLKITYTLAGAIIGWFFYRGVIVRRIKALKKMSGQDLLVKGLGLLFGLTVAALMAGIFRPYLGEVSARSLAIVAAGAVFLTWLPVMIFSVKANEINSLFFSAARPGNRKTLSGGSQFKILDTSAIIDGRIADLSKTGFLEGILVAPGFVIGELQKIADSADSLRRNRGRRGLDLLNRMQKENQIAVRIFDCEYDEVEEVDTKLLRLAREMDAKVVTNDYNLNKVAELYGVKVLNINDLSNAIKPVVLPGEEMFIHVLRDGKEYGQGIGYLDDGTMIVVEGGKSFIGLDIEILVTSVLQTSAGRMIFAKPKEILMSRVTS